MDIKKEYERWLMNATADADVAAELKTLDDTKIEDELNSQLSISCRSGIGGFACIFKDIAKVIRAFHP